MTARELIKQLERKDPDAEIVIPLWGGCNHKVANVCTREGFTKNADGTLRRDTTEGMPKGNYLLIL